MLNDRSTVHEFINLSKLLAFPGELTESTSIGKTASYFSSIFYVSIFSDFHFPNVEKPYESYVGINVKLRYFSKLFFERKTMSL
jgi:vacuolar protein sorting-associated protein 26